MNPTARDFLTKKKWKYLRSLVDITEWRAGRMKVRVPLKKWFPPINPCGVTQWSNYTAEYTSVSHDQLVQKFREANEPTLISGD